MYRAMLISSVVLMVACVASHGQVSPAASEVQVRLLDYKTGRPLPHRTVDVLLPDRDGEIRNHSRQLFRKTGKDGIAVFQIPAPLPATLWVTADFPCTRTQAFGTSETLQRGIVGDHDDFELCKNPTSQPATARPGEIVIYIRRLSPWLRFRRALWETFEGECLMMPTVHRDDASV